MNIFVWKNKQMKNLKRFFNKTNVNIANPGNLKQTFKNTTFTE